MSTAVEWVREHAETLQEIKDATANDDPYLAAEILNRLAPVPEGENVRIEEREKAHGLHFKHVTEVINPATGQRDNTDGPALVETDGTRKWYQAGMQHNESGPAVIKPNGDLRYYYLGTKYKSAEELDATIKKAKEWSQKTHSVHNQQGRANSDA